MSCTERWKSAVQNYCPLSCSLFPLNALLSGFLFSLNIIIVKFEYVYCRCHLGATCTLSPPTKKTIVQILSIVPLFSIIFQTPALFLFRSRSYGSWDHRKHRNSIENLLNKSHCPIVSESGAPYKVMHGSADVMHGIRDFILFFLNFIIPDGKKRITYRESSQSSTGE